MRRLCSICLLLLGASLAVDAGLVTVQRPFGYGKCGAGESLLCCEGIRETKMKDEATKRLPDSSRSGLLGSNLKVSSDEAPEGDSLTEVGVHGYECRAVDEFSPACTKHLACCQTYEKTLGFAGGCKSVNSSS